MTQQTVRLVLGPAVRSGHRGSRSTAFVLSNSVTFESALRCDVLTLRALGRNLADVLEQPVQIDSPGADDRACDEVVGRATGAHPGGPRRDHAAGTARGLSGPENRIAAVASLWRLLAMGACRPTCRNR